MSTRSTVAIGLALMVLGVIGAAWSSTELTSGFAEIPQHWWSTLASLPLILGAIVVVLGLGRRTRTP
jgi:hypothetical protein